jgi:hypothetical protein
VSDKPKRFDHLLKGEVRISLINEPMGERESATARAQRLWFDRAAPRGEPIKQEFNGRAS